MAVDIYARDLAAAALAKANEGNGGGNGNSTENIKTSIVGGALVGNTEYYLGLVETINVSLPIGKLGEYIYIVFKSGEQATQFNFNNDIFIGDIPTPIPNKTYEVICTWNGEKWVATYRGY
jgi:hypothetical protein